MRLEAFANANIPLLLNGRAGMPMLADALELSKALLNTDNLDVHPDFLLISSDKKSIGVESAQEVAAMASRRPVVSGVNVCVIDGMDKLTVQAQNKLLLTLENSPNLRIIGISYKGGLLDTVLSRMKMVSYHPLLLEEFVKKFTMDGYSSEEAVLFFYASDGVEAMKSLFENNKDMFREVRNNILSDKRYFLLKTLHLLQEKDKEAVTNDSELMKATLRIIARTCCDKAMELCVSNIKLAGNYAYICRLVDNDVLRVDKSSYTKNDFFDTIIKVIELEDVA